MIFEKYLKLICILNNINDINLENFKRILKEYIKEKL